MGRALARLMGLATKAHREGWSERRFVEEVVSRSETQQKIDRRNLLAWAGAGLALGACARPQWSDGASSATLGGQGVTRGSTTEPRIVVLGSGFAGMTAAHELHKKAAACLIFEARDRVGGRVFTKRGFNQDGMFIELGAEFVDSVHSDLIGLARELNIEVEDYTQPISGLATEVYLFNQKVIDSGKFLGEFKKLAALVLEDTSKIRIDKQLITPTPGRPGPSPWLDQITLADYLSSKQKSGISPEFIELINVMYLGMMGLETSQQNTYNLLTLMDPYSAEMALYGDSDESKRVKGGNGNLVDALAQSVGKHTPIHLGHRLVHIKDHGQHFVLTFDRTGNSPLEVKADLVINTLPIPVLSDIEGMTSLNLSESKKAAIKALGYATNAKFTIGFKERKWRSSGNMVPPNYGTVWTNSLFPEIRESSNQQKGRSGIILNYLGGAVGHHIPPNLVGKTLDHLESMYPGIRSLYDGHTHLQHWTSDPFAKGSYICPRPGHYEAMGGFEDQVELGGRMIFAGDSFSKDFGGYMTGV